MADYSNQADATVADLPNVGPVTGSELLYADNGRADVNITTDQIKAYAKAGLAAGDVSGLGGSASKDVGTTAGTVAAGDDSRIVGAVQTSDTDISDAGWVLDEDDMASNSAVKVPTQQSTKAYVDNRATTQTRAFLLGATSKSAIEALTTDWSGLSRADQIMLAAYLGAPGVFAAQRYGCVGDGTTDNADALDVLALAIKNNGGGCAYFPDGVYRTTRTLALSGQGMRICGAGQATTRILFDNATSDSITITGDSYSTYSYGFGIQDIYIAHTAHGAGGVALKLQYVADFTMDRAIIGDCFNGVLVSDCNNVLFNKTQIIPTAGGASHPYGMKICTSALDANHRTDVVELFGTTIQMGWHGGDAMIIDGAAYTVRGQAVALLGSRYGLQILNTGASSSYFPQFGLFDDLEIDGAQINTMRIEAGWEWYFVNSVFGNKSGDPGIGSADTDCIVVLPDASYSGTRFVQIANSHIGSSGIRHSAVNISCRDFALTGNLIHNASFGGDNTYPAIKVGEAGTTYDGTITGNKAGKADAYDSHYPNYGVEFADGVERITVTGNNFYGCGTGSVLDGSNRTTNVVTGNVGHDGKPAPDIINRDPSSSANLDASGVYFSIANGASKALLIGSGKYIIDNLNTGHCVELLLGNGLVMGSDTSSGTDFQLSSTPASGKVGFWSDGGKLTIVNNTGVSLNISVLSMRTRAIG